LSFSSDMVILQSRACQYCRSEILHGLNVVVMPCVIILLPLKGIISSDLNLPAYTFVMCKIKATYLLTYLLSFTSSWTFSLHSCISWGCTGHYRIQSLNSVGLWHLWLGDS